MKTLSIFAAAALAVAGTSAANAATTITFTGANSTTPVGGSLTFGNATVRGYTFAGLVSAYNANPNGTPLINASVRRTADGVGVAGDGETNQVDSNGANENLQVDFAGTQRYRITGASFRIIDSNDTLSLFGVNGSTATRLGFAGDIDGNPALSGGSIVATLLSSTGGTFNYSFSGSGGFDAFRFGTNREESDGFALQSITVAAVPEPATWGMMILGFGVIGGALRRRKAATARIAYA